jgi:N-acetylglutamate synthase-like GNAT family acetyltransferase
MSDEIQIRRAKRGDLAGIAALVRRATRSKLKVDEADVMEWLFSKGLWVAVLDDASTGSAEPIVVGVAACQTENLVSVTDVFYVSPAKLRVKVGDRLLIAVEEEVKTLMCEANVMPLPTWTSKAVRTFLQKQGYEPQAFDDLHRIWREVLGEFVTDETDLMVKRLRDRMVMAPV